MFKYLPKWQRIDKQEIKSLELVEGSLFKVPLTTILNIQPHPNADRLSIGTIYGFQVIIQKDKYKIGDRIIYTPVDSILPEWLENIIFPSDSKVKLTKHRVRQIRLRKVASQGLIIDLSDIKSKVNTDYLTLEQNLADILDIRKYEPPAPKASKQQTPRNKPLENSRFHKYGGVDNLKWYPNFFENQEVIIQEKIHGSNCRLSLAKTVPNTWMKRLKKLFGLLPAYEYCWGSNNVQLQHKDGSTSFYGKDVYKEVLNKVGAFNQIKQGETIFGELIGPGIQKNYEYGHKEHHFVLFDVKKEKEDGSQEYLNPEEAEAYAKERGFDFVPVLYRGVFNAALAKELSMGPSVYYPSEKVREGIVIKSRINYGINGSKKALKLISEVYLDDISNSDNH